MYHQLHPDGWHLRLKVVPGASRSRVVGVLGDRLKIQVAAPPEDGKANAAVVALLAQWLGLTERSVSLIAGHSQVLKTVRVPASTCLPPLPAASPGRDQR